MTIFKSLKKAHALIVILFLFLLQTFESQAQFLLLNDTTRTISLEVLRPNINSDIFKTSLLSSTSYLTFRLPMSSTGKNMFRIEVPIIHGKATTNIAGFGENSGETVLGNIFLGIEFGKNGGRSAFWGEFGVRLPIVDEETVFFSEAPIAFVGFFSDINRYETILPETTSISATWHIKSKIGEKQFLRLSIGPNLHIFDGTLDNDPDLFLDYNLQVQHTGDLLNVSLGFVGRYLTNREENFLFNDRAFSQLGLSTSFNLGQFEPGISFKLPLTESLSDAIDNVVGINMVYKF